MKIGLATFWADFSQTRLVTMLLTLSRVMRCEKAKKNQREPR
jgi:hypothetical protein